MNPKHVLVLLSLAAAPALLAQSETPSTPSIGLSEKLDLAALPQAAQQAIRRMSVGRGIPSITRTTVDNRVVYRASFPESGRNPDVCVAEDGSLVRPLEKPPGLSQLYIGTTFADTPVPVQTAIRREIGDREILKIEKMHGGRGNRDEIWYRVSVQGPHAATDELNIDAAGVVMSGAN